MTMPRFAKTNGDTQRSSFFEDEDFREENRTTQSFFKTLRRKIFEKKSNHSSFRMDQNTESKFQFGRANGDSTLPRTISAFSWADNTTSLHESVVCGDLLGTKRLLNLGAAANEIDSDGNTALHKAAAGDYLDVAEELLSRNADCNAANDEKETPLHAAVSNDHVDMVKLLIKHGANVNLLNKTRWTPLHEAACNGNVEMGRLLIDAGADVNICTDNGDAPLHKAARWGRLDFCRLLLESGASPLVADKFGREPLARTNQADIYNLLFTYKIRVSAGGNAANTNNPRLEDKPNDGGSISEETLRSVINKMSEWELTTEVEAYDENWKIFSTNQNEDKGRHIGFEDIPWPMHSNTLDVIKVVLQGTKDTNEKRRRLRAELLRWHPDKFYAQFGRFLREGEVDTVMHRVKEISQVLMTATKSL